MDIVRHNDEYYYQNIRDYLIHRAHAVRVDANLNRLSLAGMSEDFYVEFLNILLDISLQNANDIDRNAPGIDLIDYKNHVAVQVSVTCAPDTIRKKIRSSVKRFEKPDDEEWQFYFVPITDKAPDLQSDFKLPEGLCFDRTRDMLDITRIMELAKGIGKLKDLYLLVEEYRTAEHLRGEQHHGRLREKLDTLLLETWKHHRSFKLMQTDEIDRRLFPGVQDSHQFEALGKRKDGETDSPVWTIIRGSWKEPENHPVMIEGGGGIGKTVTLFSLTNMDKDTIPAPAIYVPMFDLIDHGRKVVKLTDYFMSSDSLDSLEAEERKELCNFAKRPWQNGPSLLVLLDGFNEVSGDHRWDVLQMLRAWQKSNPGAQLIAVSRPIDNLSLKTAFGEKTISITLSELTKESVTAYLKTIQGKGIRIPDPNAPIWKTIVYPLFLNLYIKADRLRNQQAWKDYPLQVRENVGPGSIIWNFLQRELLRSEDESWILRCAIACEYLAPILANHMMQRYDYTISQKEAVEVIKNAADEMDLDRMPTHLTELISWWETQELSSEPPRFLKKLNWPDIVLRESGLFVPYKRPTAGKSKQKAEQRFEFLHQSFRDCLSVLYLINQTEMFPENSLLRNWGHPLSNHALNFAAELIDFDTLNTLWKTNHDLQQYKNANSKRNNTATINLLELYRRNNKLTTGLDFSGMDLSGLSLTNYLGKNGTALPLFQHDEDTTHTLLDHVTFRNSGRYYSVTSIAVLSDGRVVNGSYDGTILVWDTATGQCLQTLDGHSGSVYCVAILPDECIVSGSEDGTLRVWSSTTGECLQTMAGHRDAVVCAAILPDGRVVSGSDDHTLRVWNPKTGQCLQTLEGHSDRVNCVAVLPGGRVVSSSNDGTLRVWDPTTGRHLQTMKRHKGPVHCVVILPDERIVSGSLDGTLRVWSSITGQCLKILKGHTDPVTCVAVLPSGHVVSGSADYTLRVWDVVSGQCLHTLEGHGHYVYCVAVLPDGRVVSGSEDSTLRMWDIATGQSLQTPFRHSDEVTHLAVLPDGNVISGSGYSNLQVWDSVTGICLQSMRGPSISVNCLAAIPGGYVANGLDDSTLRVWDTATGQCLQTLVGHSCSVRCVATISGKRIISGTFGSLRVWDIATGHCIQILKGHSNWITCLDSLSDGSVVSGSDDCTLRVWDLSTSQCIQTLEGHINPVNCVAALSDGRVVSGSSDCSLRVWDTATGQCLQILEGHSKSVNCTAVLKNGLIISGSDDGTMRLWDVDSGQCVNIIHCGWNTVICIAIFPDGRVVSGSLDGTLRVWDAATSQCLQTLKGHSAEVTCVAVLPDGRVVSGSGDGTMRVWDNNIGKCLDILEAMDVPVSGMDFSRAEITENLAGPLFHNGAKISERDYLRWAEKNRIRIRNKAT